MQNFLKRKNVFFIENICELCSFEPDLCYYSRSFDMHNEKL